MARSSISEDTTRRSSWCTVGDTALMQVYFIPKQQSSILSVGQLDESGCLTLIVGGIMEVRDRRRDLIAKVRGLATGCTPSPWRCPGQCAWWHQPARKLGAGMDATAISTSIPCASLHGETWCAACR